MSLADLFKRKSSFLESGFLKSFTDRHSHVLYGVDDGSRSLEESLSILSVMEKGGVRDLWCTPHIMEDYPNTTEDLKARFAQLCDNYHGTIRLHLAAEYMIDSLFFERFHQRDLLTYEDDFILMETSTWNPPSNIYAIFKDVVAAGYSPVFAHPERYRYLEGPAYERLFNMGVKFQLNLPSLLGYYGETARSKAMWLLEKDMYFYAGFDCHRQLPLVEQYESGRLPNKLFDVLKDAFGTEVKEG